MTCHQVTVQYFKDSGYVMTNYAAISSTNPFEYEHSDAGLSLVIQRPFRWKPSIKKYTTNPEGYFYVWTFQASSRARTTMTRVIEEVMRKLPLTFPLDLRLVYNKPYYIPDIDKWNPNKIIDHLNGERRL